MLKLFPSKVLLAGSSLLLLSVSNLNADVKSPEAIRFLSFRTYVGQTEVKAPVKREFVDADAQTDAQTNNAVQDILSSVDNGNTGAENKIERVDTETQTDDSENGYLSNDNLENEIKKLQDIDSGRTDVQDIDSGRTDDKKPSETWLRWTGRNIVWPLVKTLGFVEFGSVFTRAIQQGSAKNIWPVFTGDMIYLAKICKDVFSKKAIENAAKENDAKAWF